MRQARKLLIGSVLGLGIILVALILWLKAPAGALTAVPSPNGYDEFLRAGSLIQGDNLSDFPILETRELAALVKSNSAALAAGRRGLALPCAVPTDGLFKTNSFRTSDLPAVKRLAQLFAAEGHLAEIENRPGDAAQSYVDAVRLGNESSRSGFIIHRLVGVACEAIGLSRLVNIIPKLDCDSGRAVISDLQKVDAAGVEWSSVLKSERRFMWHQIKQYRNPLRLLHDMWPSRSLERSAQRRHDTVVAQRRLLMVELALRCFKTVQGHSANNLAELSPKYLNALPMDPFTGKPLVYRQQGTNWMLYSVGQNKIDNGGTSAAQFYGSARSH